MAPTKHLLVLAIATLAVAIPSNHGRGQHAHLHRKHDTAPAYGYEPNASTTGASAASSVSYAQDDCTDVEAAATTASSSYVEITTTSTDSGVPSASPTDDCTDVEAAATSVTSSYVEITTTSIDTDTGVPTVSPADNCTEVEGTATSATGGYVDSTTTATDSGVPLTNTPPASYGPPPSWLSAHSSATVTGAGYPAGPASSASVSTPVEAASTDCEEHVVTVYTTITVPCSTVYETDDQTPTAPTSTSALSVQAVQSSKSGPAAPSYAQSSSASPAAAAESTSVPKAYSPPTSAAAASSSDIITFTGAAKQQEVPTAATSSSAQAQATAYSPSSSSSGKRGLAYNDVNLLECFADSSLITWGYNWAMSAETGFPSGIKYIPMFWGLKNGVNAASWSSAATTGIANGAQYLMSFNEPDVASESNMKPADAATAYTTYMQPFAGKAKLVAPSVSSTDVSQSTADSPVGLDWLGNFTQSCQGCTFDAYNLHWYGPAGSASLFKEYIQGAQQQLQAKEIFISEFGLYSGCSDADISTFLKDVMPWMDSQDYIVGYSYFMVASGSLVSGSELSSYGQLYANYTSSG